MRIAALTIIAAAALAGTSAGAAVIVPVSAVGSSSFGGYEAMFAIDQGAGSATTDWSSASQGPGATLRLDLGGVFSLASALVTDRVTSGGGNGGFVGGISDFTTGFTLQAFTDASFTTTLGAAFSVTKSAPIAPSGPADFLTSVALGGLSARFVQYRVDAASGSNNGLSDIRFESADAPAVPEPATWATLLTGFGLVGGAMRRRRRAAPFAAA